MKFNKIVSIALSSAMCLSLAACGNSGESGTENAQNIVLAESWDFSTGFYVVLSADNSANFGAGYWSRNFYNTLVSYNDEGEIQSELAETWDVSEDGTVYTFYLREGVQFSDGTALTADAVKQSFEAAIINLGSYNGTYGRLSGIITDMQAPDENTFVMTLASPYYGALGDLTMCMPLAVINPAAFEGGVENAYENCMNATMGTGPYMFDSYENDTYTFVRNPYYWGEVPEVDSFKVKSIPDNDAKILALRSGEIDMIPGSARMSADGFTELSADVAFGSSVNSESTMTRYLGMNLSTAPFNDPLVREAVAYAIDQQELETSVFNGIETAAETMFTDTKPYCDVEQITYETNIEQAKLLMKEAGYIDSDGDGTLEKDGAPLEISLSYTQSLASLDNAALAVAAQLQAIGFKVNISASDMMTWYGEILSGMYDLALWYTYGGVYDPTTVMTNMSPTNSADPIAVQFAAFFEDAGVIDELNSTADLNRVQEIYTSVLQTIANENLIVPITYTHELALWDTGKIENYDYYPDPNYVNIAGIHLK